MAKAFCTLSYKFRVCPATARISPLFDEVKQMTAGNSAGPEPLIIGKCLGV